MYQSKTPLLDHIQEEAPFAKCPYSQWIDDDAQPQQQSLIEIPNANSLFVAGKRNVWVCIYDYLFEVKSFAWQIKILHMDQSFINGNKEKILHNSKCNAIPLSSSHSFIRSAFEINTHTNTHFGCDEYYTSLLSSTLLKTYEDDSMWCMCNFSNWNMWIARLIGAQQQLDKCAKKLLIICKCEKWPRCNTVPNWISMRINDDHDVTVSQQPLILTICGRIMPKKWFLCFHWCQPLR